MFAKLEGVCRLSLADCRRQIVTPLRDKGTKRCKKGCTVRTGGSELPDASVAIFSVFSLVGESSTRNPILRLEFLMVHWSETKFVECDAGKMHLEGCMVPSIRPWMKSRFFGAPVIFFFCPFKKGASQFGDGGAV